MDLKRKKKTETAAGSVKQQPRKMTTQPPPIPFQKSLLYIVDGRKGRNVTTAAILAYFLKEKRENMTRYSLKGIFFISFLQIDVSQGFVFSV